MSISDYANIQVVSNCKSNVVKSFKILSGFLYRVNNREFSSLEFTYYN